MTNVAGYSTYSVAQHTFALLFYVLEKLSYYDGYVKSGAYCDSRMFTNLDRKFYEIRGKVWGIIGLGNIGREVARIAEAFGCRVIYYSYDRKEQRSVLRAGGAGHLASDIGYTVHPCAASMRRRKT